MTTPGPNSSIPSTGNNNANNNGNSTQGSASSSNQFYRLKVEDALSYLDQVKLQFESQPHVYNHFLDIMKEFKSQTIDTPGVISRVSNLFRGHTDLIEGFNTFLPPGYKIEVQENNAVHFTAPNSTLSTLVQPISGNVTTFVQATTTSNNNQQEASNSGQRSTPTILTAQPNPNIPTLVNLTCANVIKGGDPQIKQGEPLLLTPYMSGGPNTSNPANFSSFKSVQQSGGLSVKILPTSTTIGGTVVPSSSVGLSTGIAQPINIQSTTPPPKASNLSVSSLTVASQSSSSNPSASSTAQVNPQSQVEFGHAINYVNKIKSRFSNQPDIYKSFLEILHTYQKQQKNLKDGVTSGTQGFLSEAEVYAKVAKLFKNQEDLLAEFSQFLPDASGGGGGGGSSGGSGLLGTAGGSLQPIQSQSNQQPGQLIHDSQMSSIITSNLNEFSSQFVSNQQIPFLPQSILNVPIPNMTTFNPASSTINVLQQQQQQQQQASSTLSNSKVNEVNSMTPNKQKINQQHSATSSSMQASSSSPSHNQRANIKTENNQQNHQDFANHSPADQIKTGFKETGSYKRISQYQQMSSKKQKINSIVNCKDQLNLTSAKANDRSYNPNQNYSQFNPQQAQSDLSSVTVGKVQNSNTLNEVTFFERLKKALRTQQVYDNFLKCLALFNQDIVTRSELIALVEPFLGKFANLYRWFKDYVENRPLNSSLLDGNNDLARFDSSGKNRIYLPPGNYSLEIDYLSCKQYGASYRDISSYPQPISTGQTDLCKQVLNAVYVSFPSWSEDSTFISSKKNQYEELIFRIEDERFELDVVLETNLSTIRVLENIMTKLSHMNTDELTKFRLGNNLGGTSETIHLKAIQRVYGEKAKDFIDGLKRNPVVAVPLVLKRLRAKDEEWREAKKTLEKQWCEQIERNYLKSLDHCAVPFKQNDQKQLKTKSLINEIEEAKEEAQQAACNHATAAAASVSHQIGLAVTPGTTDKIATVSSHQPHIIIKYQDKSILDDAAALIIHHVKRQTTIQREDKHRIKEIIYHFLPDLLYVQRGALSDDESSPDPAPAANFETENESAAAAEQEAAATKKLRSASSTGGNQLTISQQQRHTDTNKRRITEPQDTNKNDSTNEYKTPEDMYRLFFVDNHWYLFCRYHHILCERLYKIYKHSLQVAEQSNVESRSREQSVAEALKLRNKSEIPVDEYYPAFLDIVRNLLDGNMESTQYEDTLREMFGIHAYISFTLDKVVHNCVRQLQYLVQDEVSSSVKQIYLDEVRANHMVSSCIVGGSGAVGGGCGGKVANISYSSVMNAEMLYQKKVEALLNNQKLFRIMSYKNSYRLTIDLMDTQDSDEDEEDANEELADIEKWSEYIEKYCSNSSEALSNELKLELLNKPVFLTRNAHVLKRKYGNALIAKQKALEKLAKRNEADSTKENGKEVLLESIKEENACDVEKFQSILEDICIQDESVYKFQTNCFKLVPGQNSTSVMYRKNSLKKARKSHPAVTKKMFSSFRSYLNQWLKSNSTPQDCIDDILMGEHLEPQVKTTCFKESFLKKPPYHVYYKYKSTTTDVAPPPSAKSLTDAKADTTPVIERK